MSRFRDEIGEQPELAARLLGDAGRARGDSERVRRTERPRGFVIAARGSSDHAADYARYLFGRRHRALVSLAAPSLVHALRQPARM